MAKNLEALRKSSGATIDALKRETRFDIGAQRNTTLEKALGAVRADRSILNRQVQKRHEARLAKSYEKYWKHLGQEDQRSRLRFLTILHEVTGADAGEMVASAQKLKDQLTSVLSQTMSIFVVGAVELEIVNMTLMASYAAQNKLNLSADDDSRAGEARKLNVCSAIASKKMARALSGAHALGQQHIIGCLVHVHAVIDLGGKDHGTRLDKSEIIRVALKKVWESQYQVRIESLYADKDVGKSLTDIARYMVKGGNEKLRYHFGFGREVNDDSMGRSIAKKGGLSYAEIDAGGKDTELALSHYEIDVLDSAYSSLMDSKNANWRDGYKFVHGQEIRHKKIVSFFDSLSR